MKVMHTAGKFSASTPNGESELLYINRNNTSLRIYRTFTPDKDEGNGVVEKLTVAAFNFAKKSKLKVRPDCPAIIMFLEKHKEFEKLLVADKGARS